MQPKSSSKWFPKWPDMSLIEVKSQMTSVSRLDRQLQELCEDIKTQNPELEIKTPPQDSVQPPSASRSLGDLPLPTFSIEEKDPELGALVRMLKPMVHPLLLQSTVKPYGVLGNSESERDPDVRKPLEAVIVDPAGFPFIGARNNPRGAGGASGSIYRWLGVGSFPDEVHSHFRASYEADAETRAKFHSYSDGQHIIHAIGPKINEITEAIPELARTYMNVLSEFCAGVSAISNNRKTPPKLLRLLPISSGIFLFNKKLERYMADITFCALSVACAALPPNNQEVLKTCSVEICIFQKKEVKVYESVLEEKKASLTGKPKLDKDFGCLSKKHGDFSWIRMKNGPADRFERLDAFLMTEQATCCRGYILPNGKVVNLNAIDELLKGTRIRRATDKLQVASMTGSRLNVQGDEAATVMDIAMRCHSEGKAVVAVSAASAYQPGGGVLKGSRHAMEETWCMMSTLLRSILSKKDHEAETHIPTDGCIVSPAVEIFRSTSAEGYRFLETPVKLAGVVNMAMFNMNPRMNDAPQDAPRDFQKYCEQVKKKCAALIGGAAELGAEVFVTPDIGCGVFENDPKIVGALLGEALAEMPGHFSEVWITGKHDFFEAAIKAASGEKVRLEVPAYYFTSGTAHEWEAPSKTLSNTSVVENPAQSASNDSLKVNNPSGNVGSGQQSANASSTTSQKDGSKQGLRDTGTSDAAPKSISPQTGGARPITEQKGKDAAAKTRVS
jgi:uncharacterized protein (TIGR02452 family)